MCVCCVVSYVSFVLCALQCTCGRKAMPITGGKAINQSINQSINQPAWYPFATVPSYVYIWKKENIINHTVANYLDI